MVSKQNFRFELERGYGRRFRATLRKMGYRTFAEWVREQVRKVMEEE